ncbi:MAG: DUF2889 domain-containing protein [Proteobacteria bacterium]|nr:DUF2889 domain-containing protein [Pseudomonadota bacterium]MBU2227869.1 DUF2889 domain-containing protein [Pseudomonadota bacterium]MBU2263013.1 DUF2889 domain-containing protein [Pseudomonadota bacterium]
MKKDLIHSRKITVNCYETDEEELIIEGSLIDERLFPFQIHALNERREAGPIHHIALSMKLSVPQLEIISLNSEMPVVPDAGCREIKDAVQKLAGRHIRPGFTNEARELFGKTEGCLHLTNLLLAMSSAAIQGLWSHFSRIRQGKTPPLPPTDPLMLLNSCHMWRKDGPFVERIERRRDAARNGEQRSYAEGLPDE